MKPRIWRTQKQRLKGGVKTNCVFSLGMGNLRLRTAPSFKHNEMIGSTDPL
jgi:hypothetical protein